MHSQYCSNEDNEPLLTSHHPLRLPKHPPPHLNPLKAPRPQVQLHLLDNLKPTTSINTGSRAGSLQNRRQAQFVRAIATPLYEFRAGAAALVRGVGDEDLEIWGVVSVQRWSWRKCEKTHLRKGES